MKQLLLAAAIAAGALSIAACSSSASSSPMPAAYTNAINQMTAYCTQDAAGIEGMVDATHGIEVKGGVTGESLTQLAVNLEKVVSANGKPISTCAQEFAAYATMRTGGS